MYDVIDAWVAIAAAFFITCVVHEAGHAAMAWFFENPITDYGWDSFLEGPYIRRKQHPVAWKDRMISAGGILANVITALVAWQCHEHWMMQFNLVLGLSNALPFRGLDGWRVYGKNLADLVFGPEGNL